MKEQPKTPDPVEQAAENAGHIYYNQDKPTGTYTFHEGFKKGSEWQSQHSYTELEVLSMLEDLKQKCVHEAKVFQHSRDYKIHVIATIVRQKIMISEVDKESILSINVNELLIKK